MLPRYGTRRGVGDPWCGAGLAWGANSGNGAACWHFGCSRRTPCAVTDLDDIKDGGISRAEEEAMQHQFGSIVLMADVYRQELLADAARSRPIPATNSSEGFVTGLLPVSVVNQSVPTLLRRQLGTLLVRVGQRLQEARAVTGARLGLGPTGEVSATA